MLRKFRTEFVIIFLLLILVYSLLYSLIYNYFVIGKIGEFDLKFKNVCDQLSIELPHKDTYLIKIWGLYYPKKIYFNKIEVTPFMTRERGELKELFIKVENTSVNKGINLLNIISNYSYSARVKNFYGTTESNKIYILFKASRFLKFEPERLILITLFAFLTFILVFILLYVMTKFIFLNFRLGKLFILFSICNSALFFLFLFIIFLLLFTPYRVVFSSSAFLGLSIFLLFLINLIFTHRYLRQLTLTHKARRFMASIIKLSFDQNKELNLNVLLDELIVNFKKAPGQYLVSAFIFSLFICMLLFSFKLYTIANLISYLAYFCLAVGLGINFVKLIKENR